MLLIEKLYLEYSNDFSTVEKFAEHHNINVDHARDIINFGRKMNNNEHYQMVATIKEFQLTPKTLVYQVCIDNISIVQSKNRNACINFAKFINKNINHQDDFLTIDAKYMIDIIKAFNVIPSEIRKRIYSIKEN